MANPDGIRGEKVTADDRVNTWWPNKMSAVMQPGRDAARMFDGHQLVPESTGLTPVRLKGYNTRKTLRVDEPALMEKGEYYRLMAVRPGDRMLIAVQTVLERTADGGWHLRTAAAARVRLPGSTPGSKWLVFSVGGTRSKVTADGEGWIAIPSERQGSEGVILKPF